MKLLQIMLFALSMTLAVAAHGENKDAQVKPLMDKITAALKAGRSSEALPYMAQLEEMELDISSPLPESFYYYYIDTLYKTGDKDKALNRGQLYLKKFGQNEKHYDQVSEIVNRLQKGRVKGAAAMKMARLTDCPDCPEMVRIPGKNYEMGKYEVTQAQWKAIMGNNPSKFTDCGGDCPVEQVSWNDAQEFIKKLNAKTGMQYRLPTEAEWLHACYGGGKTKYCGSNDIDSVAWYDRTSAHSTHAVGQKQANKFGLYDMSGNVYEWTSDCWEGDCSQRVIRGGSWGDQEQESRATYRYGERVDDLDKNYGFRLVITRAYRAENAHKAH